MCKDHLRVELYCASVSQHEKCPNTEFFLGLNTETYCISPYSVEMRENMDQKNLSIWTLFTQYLGI